MQIIVSVSDLIKRCLFSSYKKFVLYDKTDEEIRNMVIEDLPTVISEEDAFVIGLLKCVETDNIIHRFNQHINEVLQIRSISVDSNLLINKASLLKEVISFKSRFPSYAKLPENYTKSISDCMTHIDTIREKIEKMTITKVKRQDKISECVESKKVRKLLEL